MNLFDPPLCNVIIRKVIILLWYVFYLQQFHSLRSLNKCITFKLALVPSLNRLLMFLEEAMEKMVTVT